MILNRFQIRKYLASGVLMNPKDFPLNPELEDYPINEKSGGFRSVPIIENLTETGDEGTSPFFLLFTKRIFPECAVVGSSFILERNSYYVLEMKETINTSSNIVGHIVPHPNLFHFIVSPFVIPPCSRVNPKVSIYVTNQINMSPSLFLVYFELIGV